MFLILYHKFVLFVFIVYYCIIDSYFLCLSFNTVSNSLLLLLFMLILYSTSAQCSVGCVGNLPAVGCVNTMQLMVAPRKCKYKL